MINTDLRIGNNVFFDFHKDSGGRKIVEVFAKDLVNMEKERMLKSYSGIPITEESVTILGFKKRGEGVFNNMDGNIKVSVYFYKTSTRIHFFMKGDNKLMIDSFKYIHEIQNLYYCLSAHEIKSVGEK